MEAGSKKRVSPSNVYTIHSRCGDLTAHPLLHKQNETCGKYRALYCTISPAQKPNTVLLVLQMRMAFAAPKLQMRMAFAAPKLKVVQIDGGWMMVLLANQEMLGPRFFIS
jgi:hypothetical protein